MPLIQPAPGFCINLLQALGYTSCILVGHDWTYIMVIISNGLFPEILKRAGAVIFNIICVGQNFHTCEVQKYCLHYTVYIKTKVQKYC